jgi:hypothetical protein
VKIHAVALDRRLAFRLVLRLRAWAAKRIKVREEVGTRVGMFSAWYSSRS